MSSLQDFQIASKKEKQTKKFTMEIGGKELVVEVGKHAQQAQGSALVSYGETVILATCCMAEEPNKEVDFLPLTCEYQEKFYAAGKIKGSRFVRREGRPSEEAVLTSRRIDRALRPFFPPYLRQEIQVIVDVLSFDGENDSDIPALIGASVALNVSEIPFEAILAGVRIGRIDGQWVLNPTFKAREKSELDLTCTFADGKVVMLEAQASEVPEDIFFEAIKFGKKHTQKINDFIKKIKAEEGKEKRIIGQYEQDPKLFSDVEKFTRDEVIQILFKETKKDRKKLIARLSSEIIERLKEKYGEEKEMEIKTIFKEIVEDEVRKNILEKDLRIGGRKTDELRKLSVKVAYLPRTHGSALFQRGETEVLSVVTLGAPSDELIVDEMEEECKKHFMHHYNFPPFSVGEVQPIRGPSRRDIGHGALVEKALSSVIPKKEDFPYTIRVVSEVLSSNGSSSMASVCASSLALMDAGVPVKTACAGIAMGLVQDEKGNYKILTDLQDLEDTKGGMDFKIAGTDRGICAVQMDTKSEGLTDEQIKGTLAQARKARLEILEVMDKVISKPRVTVSPYAPKIISLRINPERIREVIGPGGRVINEIIGKTGVEIDIENDGQVYITSQEREAAEKAAAWIKDIVREVKIGEIFTGKVARTLAFGALVELFPGTEGLIHISNLAPYRVRRVEDIVKVGDIVKVKVIEIDKEGRINLSLVEKNSRVHS